MIMTGTYDVIVQYHTATLFGWLSILLLLSIIRYGYVKNLIISGPTDYLETVKQYSDDIAWVTKTQNIEYLQKDGIACICEL